MRLATLKRGGRDGTLVAVSADGARVAEVPGLPTLQAALDDWGAALTPLREAAAASEDGEAVEPAAFAAPLPRAWQWLDGSAFPTHGELIAHAAYSRSLPADDHRIGHRIQPRPFQCRLDLHQRAPSDRDDRARRPAHAVPVIW